MGLSPEMLWEKVQLLPVLVPALVIAAALHELAHGLVADRLGDPTPRREGRLTLNPIRHLDPMGSAMFGITFLLMPFAFGWARPIMVQPRNFPNPKVGMGIVAVAGPITNFLLAYLTIVVLSGGLAESLLSGGNDYMFNAVWLFVYLNIVLGVFNLLPIPPLDGSRIVGMFLPDDAHETWSRLDAYGAVFLLAIFLLLSGPVFAIVGEGIELALQVIYWLPGADPMLGLG